MEQKDYYPSIPAFRKSQEALYAIDKIFNLKIMDNPNQYIFRTNAGNFILLKFQHSSNGMLRKLIIKYIFDSGIPKRDNAATDLTAAILKILTALKISPPTGILSHITEKGAKYGESEFNAVYRLVYHHNLTFFIEAYDTAFTNGMHNEYLKKYGLDRYNKLIEATKAAFLD